MNRPKNSGDMVGAQSVDRALGLLSLVGRGPTSGMALSVIVADTGLSRPTARRLLLALISAGLIEQNPETKTYSLGEEAYVLGILATRRFDIVDVAAESVALLAEKSTDTAFLSIRRDGFSVCLHKAEGSFPIRTHALQIGFSHPLGVGAGSLAILAALPEDEAEAMLAQNENVMREQFPNVTTAVLGPLLADARTKGWALNPGLVLDNSWAVGVAIKLPDGRVSGALSIAALDNRLKPDRAEYLAGLLKIEARRIEARLVRRVAKNEARHKGG